MNFAVILSGGIGTRMQTDGIPKQYMIIQNRPVIMYALDAFEAAEEIDGYVIVADVSYHDTIRGWLQEEGKKKFLGFAIPGESRQGSVLQGLEACVPFSKGEEDLVMVHDAVRPCVTVSQIQAGVETLQKFDASLPVVRLVDTIVFSQTGEKMDDLADRSKLMAAQSPEGFHLHQYLRVNRAATEEELRSCTGASTMAYRNHLSVGLYEGDYSNFKLTVPADIDRFALQLNHKDNR